MIVHSDAIEKIIEKDNRYDKEAYIFALYCLQICMETTKKEGKKRHVTGQELCEIFRKTGHHYFGFLAKTVFNHWGLTKTRDFGNIVYNLIDVDLLQKRDEDNINDFDNIFKFKELEKYDLGDKKNWMQRED